MYPLASGKQIAVLALAPVRPFRVTIQELHHHLDIMTMLMPWCDFRTGLGRASIFQCAMYRFERNDDDTASDHVPELVDPAAFDALRLRNACPDLRAIPGIRSVTFNQGPITSIAGANNVYLVAQVTFDSLMDYFNTALASVLAQRRLQICQILRVPVSRS